MREREHRRTDLVTRGYFEALAGHRYACVQYERIAAADREVHKRTRPPGAQLILDEHMRRCQPPFFNGRAIIDGPSRNAE